MDNSNVVRVKYKDQKKNVFSPTTFESFLECGEDLNINFYYTLIMACVYIMFKLVSPLKLPTSLTFQQWI